MKVTERQRKFIRIFDTIGTSLPRIACQPTGTLPDRPLPQPTPREPWRVNETS